jgi:hypothetical protein
LKRRFSRTVCKKTLTVFRNDYDIAHESWDVKDGEMVFCLKMVDRPLYSNNETITIFLVLKKLVLRPWEFKGLRGDYEYERIGILKDSRTPPELGIEDVSEQHDIQYDAVVKMI